ncbi:MAG: class II aldolase/adducin family protein [Methylophilaceae bacterium]
MREALLALCQRLEQLGLHKGTSGNVSLRCEQGFWITPSGKDNAELQAEDMVLMDLAANCLSPGKPSSEWRFHRDIYQAKPEVQAVVHTHSMFATSLSCLRNDIPAFHYMIAVAGGDSIRCAPYALFGSQALSDHALQALQQRHACLLANHGMIATGRSAQHALSVALEVETLCEQYWRALQVGQPHILSDAEMQQVFEQFKGYGDWGKNNA